MIEDIYSKGIGLFNDSFDELYSLSYFVFVIIMFIMFIDETRSFYLNFRNDFKKLKKVEI